MLKDKNVSLFTKKQFSNENQNQQAPGQFLKHYAPYIETFLLNRSDDIRYLSNIKGAEV